MKLIFRYTIALSLLFMSIGVSAHSPDVSSTMLVEESEDKWILQIRAALTAFEYEIEYNFGTSSYATPEEFQGLVVKHVLEHMLIQANDVNKVELKNGIVKLGHETSVTFEVVGIPNNLELLHVSNKSFVNITRSQSALIVLKQGFEKDQFKLDSNNDHTALLEVNQSKFVLATPTVEKTSFPYPTVLGFALIPIAIFLRSKIIRKSASKLDGIH